MFVGLILRLRSSLGPLVAPIVLTAHLKWAPSLYPGLVCIPMSRSLPGDDECNL